MKSSSNMNAPKFSSSPQAATSFSYSPNSNLDTNEPKAHSGQLQATSADEIENMLADGRRSPILIVDDEPFVADLMFHWVHTVWDYPSIIAHTGEDAIIAMREQHPRLALLAIK